MEVRRHGGWTVVGITDDLDRAAAPALRQLLVQQHPPGARRDPLAPPGAGYLGWQTLNGGQPEVVDTPAASAVAPATTPAADEQSVAVLPFVNESSDKEQEYFADGLTETMIDLLTKVIPVDNILFASEMIGAVRGIDPDTGFPYDETKRYIDCATTLSHEYRPTTYASNAEHACPRPDAAPKAEAT